MVKGDLLRAFSLATLQLSWEWLKVNKDGFYKQYFRHTYRSYSLAENELILNLSKRLIKGNYEPSLGVKVYVPKKSGILRPITLLAIEDQIVYQSLVSIIAEKVYRKKAVQDNKYEKYFGNVFGGRKSFFFYEPWEIGYEKFTKKFTDSYNKGFNYTASFDLTACYDSISHDVIKHFLRNYNLDNEFCDFLTTLLERWSAHDQFPAPIYHGHGIPQGPMSSGLLSEIVLLQFDNEFTKLKNVRYMRYVDDIRLLAKNDQELRKNLIKLDLKSKALGLFPQSSKIDIHKIVDLDQELKKIDFQYTEVQDGFTSGAEEKRVIQKLLGDTKYNKITNETEFKFDLGKVRPKYGLQTRLLNLLERYPHLNGSILNSFAKLPAFSKSVSQNMLNLIKSEQLYHSYLSKLLTLSRERVHKDSQKELVDLAKQIQKKDSYKSDPELRAAVNSVLFFYVTKKNGDALKKLLKEKSWWVKGKSVTYLQNDGVIYEKIIFQSLKDGSVDVSLSATDLYLTYGLKYHKIKILNEATQIILKKEGLVRRVYKSKCNLKDISRNLFDLPLEFDWKKVLGTHYEAILDKSLRWGSYYRSDPTTWINFTDSINDVILNRLFEHEAGKIGGAPGLGYVGRVLNGTVNPFSKKFPKYHAASTLLHNTRLQSDLSHPHTKTTGNYTRYITYKEMKKISKALSDGLEEIWNFSFKYL